MGNIARDGAPKNTKTNFAAATPAHQVNIGGVPVPISGISKTTVQRLLGNDNGLAEVHGGGETTTVTLKNGHRGEAPKVHPAMTSQRQRSATINGGDVLAAAVLSGSTKLPAQTSEEDCPASLIRKR